MATISRLSVDLVANSAKFRKDLDKASKSANKSFGSMMKSAKAATAAFAAVGVAAGSVFIASAKTYGNFTEALQDVKAKTGATKRQLDELSVSMRNAAKATRFTATETAQAGTFLAQAGLNVREINDALRPTLDLAAATKTSVQNTADFMTNIMKGMGMESNELERAADVLAVTTAKSNTNLTDLATAMSYAAPSARAMGMEIEETATLIGMMANAGIKGSMAGTALRGSFAALATTGGVTEKAIADSTGAMTQQVKVLRRLGVHTKDAQGNVRGLTDILTDLKAAGGDEQDMIAIFGRRAGSAMMQFMNEGLAGAGALKEKLDNARKAAEKMAATQMDSLNGDLLLFNSQLEELQMVVAENGINDLFRGITQSATKFLRAAEPALASMAVYFDEIAVGLAVLTGAVVLVGIAALTTAMWGLAVAMLANPITWIVAGLVALGVAIYKTIENWDFLKVVFRNFVGETANSLKNMGRSWKKIFLDIRDGTLGVFAKMQLGFARFKLGFITIFNELLQAALVKVNNLLEIYNKIPFLDDATPIAFQIDTTQATAKVVALEKKLKEIEARNNAFTESIFTPEVYTPKVEDGGAGLDDATTDSGAGDGEDAGGQKAKTRGFLESIKMTATELESIFDKVETKAQSVFTSMLTGTQSLASGFKELGQTILTSVVGSFVQMALTYIKQKLLMFAMDKLGLGTTTALTVAAGTTMATALAPAATMMSLATAGGNAIPAAAGIVSTYALSQGLALSGQLHDGIENVPNTGTYLLEQGERVVDKRLNKDMSSFLADQNQGGNTTTNNPTLNFNVTGGDADNVEQMLMNHRGKFEGMIRDIYAESAQNAPF
jgi:TP901 family phage tail tape measure protein